MITQADEFFNKGCGRCPRFATPECSTKRWRQGLDRLRHICLDEGLTETAKWGHPCYTHAGRNIVLIGAFQGDFRLSFFNAGLMKDAEGLLEPAGPNSPQPGVIRLRDNRDAERLAPAIRSYLKEAMAYAEAGAKPPRIATDIVLPDELVEAMDADPELAEAFHRLTPGRRRSYAINLASAKSSATRIARIERFRDRIIAGKGAMER